MKSRPIAVFFLSFALGTATLFSGHALLSGMLTPHPDARIGPIDIPAA